MTNHFPIETTFMTAVLELDGAVKKSSLLPFSVQKKGRQQQQKTSLKIKWPSFSFIARVAVV